MKSEIKKEILTKENCKLDLMKPRDPIFVWIILSALFLMLVGLLIAMGVNADDPRDYFAVTAFSILTFLLFMIIPVVVLIRWRRNRRARTGKFHIEQDVLVRARQDVYHHFPSRWDTGLRDMLQFSGHGSYFIDRQYGRSVMVESSGVSYYKWSSLYKMRSDGVFNTAIAGDQFYLVVYDDDREKNPVMVYNAKFFDYKEELWENG